MLRRFTTGKATLGKALLFSTSLSPTLLGAQATWAKFGGQAAMDVGANAASTVWAISAIPGSRDGLVLRWNGSSFVQTNGNGTRVAVDPQGNAWVVNSKNDLFHSSPGANGATTWTYIQEQKAIDVAVAPDGTPWVIAPDQRILSFKNGVWTAVSGGGVKIAVNTDGYPWVVNAGGQIWRMNAAGWHILLGSASDIAIGPSGTVFILGTKATDGGFEVLQLADGRWSPVGTTGGISVAAGPTSVYVAQNESAGSQLLASTYAAPSNQIVILNAVPVITQPQQASPILIGGTTSIAVGPAPVSTASMASAIPPSTAALRRFFPVGLSYEAKMLTAIKYGMYANRIYLAGQIPTGASLPPLDRGFAQLAMLSTEAYFNSQPTMTADEALLRLKIDVTARRAVIGYMGVLLAGKMMDKSRDPVTVALRQWATDLYRNQRITLAKASLDQYLMWKADPCGYEGLPPRQCQTMANLFTTRTPPQDMLALKSMNTVLGIRALKWPR